MSAPEVAAPARRTPFWLELTLAIVFGLFYAYDAWEAVGNLIGMAQVASALETTINGIGWLVLIAAILGVALVYRIPERYEASARVYVDTESLLRPLLAGLAIQPDLDQQVQLMSRTLISRPNVERLIRMADLDLRAPSNAEREELIDSITQKLWPLGDDMAFVPGHGPTSTFGRERQSNPFVADRLTGYAGAEKQAPDVGEQRTTKRYT